jgi:hypothetical protein
MYLYNKLKQQDHFVYEGHEEQLQTNNKQPKDYWAAQQQQAPNNFDFDFGPP